MEWIIDEQENKRIQSNEEKLKIAMNRLQNLSQMMNAYYNESIPTDFIINWLDETVDAILKIE